MAALILLLALSAVALIELSMAATDATCSCLAGTSASGRLLCFPFCACSDYRAGSRPWRLEYVSMSSNTTAATINFRLARRSVPTASQSACYKQLRAAGIDKIQIDTSSACGKRDVKVWINGVYCSSCGVNVPANAKSKRYIKVRGISTASADAGATIRIEGQGSCRTAALLLNSRGRPIQFAYSLYDNTNSKVCCPSACGSTRVGSPLASPPPSPPKPVRKPSPPSPPKPVVRPPFPSPPSPPSVPDVNVATINGTRQCSATPRVTRPGAAGPVDVYFLSDTTGSMGDAINSVKTSALSLVQAFKAVADDIRLGFGEYKDELDIFTYRSNLDIGAHGNSAIQNAVNAWFASGGGDTPERALDALQVIATNSSVGWRESSLKFVVWFGDAVAKDPTLGGRSLNAVIDALKERDIKVIALDLGNLDSTGQATAITRATSGQLVSGVSYSAVASFINSTLIDEILSYVSVRPVAVGCSNSAITLEMADARFQTVLTGEEVCTVPSFTTPCPPPRGTTCTWNWVDSSSGIVVRNVRQAVPAACP